MSEPPDASPDPLPLTTVLRDLIVLPGLRRGVVLSLLAAATVGVVIALAAGTINP